MSNTRIWDALGKTDPAQTKPFQRAGGFSGTAVKPMWSFKRMTEHFGPCGIGWGNVEPQFQVHPAGEEMMVFCTAGIWYREGDLKSDIIYGVGGDKFYISQKSGVRSSDEAFKAAYTDALGNAMKLIGVAADVHMGLFDDNKYVREVGEEFKTERQQTTRSVKPPVNMDAEPPNEFDEHMEQARPKKTGRTITEPMAKRFYAKAVSAGKSKKEIIDYLGSKGYERTGEILSAEYDDMCKWAESAA